MTETIAGAAQLWRKKPVTVSAVRWTGVNEDELTEFARAESLGSHFYVLDDEDRANCADPAATAQVYDKLHSTWVLVYDGQWIVKGVRGEFYPCAADVFAETYEAAAGSPPVSRDALEQLATDWAAPADRPATLTHDEIVEQHVYEECARSLRSLLSGGDAPTGASEDSRQVPASSQVRSSAVEDGQ